MLYFDIIPKELLGLIVSQLNTYKDGAGILGIIDYNEYITEKYVLIDLGIIPSSIRHPDISNCLIGSKDYLVQKFYEDMMIEFSEFDFQQVIDLDDLRREILSNYTMSVEHSDETVLNWQISKTSSSVEIERLDYGDDMLHFYAIIIPIKMII